MALNPIHTYRHLLRGIRIAFQGDIPTLRSARAAARGQFEQGRATAVAGDDEAVGEGLRHAEEVAVFLRRNVVQGVREGGEEEGGLFRLRIHEDIERGENYNESNPRPKAERMAKTGLEGRGMKMPKVKCCSES